MKDTVCYVLDAFPASSETFIANELLELVRRGVEVHIVSMARPDITTVLHPGVASLLPRVTYLDDTSRQRQLRTLGATVLHNPVGLLHACRTTQKLGGHYTWILRHTFPLIEALRRCRCQRVHVHFGGPALEYVALACSVLRKPFTVTLHGSDIFLRPLKALRKRCTLALRFPLNLSLSARTSSDSIAGTWGFGLWNDPFGLSLGFGGSPFRLPALPHAAWFFGASKENYLSFRDASTTPPTNGGSAQREIPVGNGFLAQTSSIAEVSSVVSACRARTPLLAQAGTAVVRKGHPR